MPFSSKDMMSQANAMNVVALDSRVSSGLESGPDGPQPPAGGKDLEEFVTRVWGIGHNLTCPPQGPRGEQVL